VIGAVSSIGFGFILALCLVSARFKSTVHLVRFLCLLPKILVPQVRVRR
jgi:hypothetical protein